MTDKPCKIGINLLFMNRKLTGGSITYGINLVNELAKLDKANKYYIYINKDCTDLPIKVGDNFKIKVIPFHNKNVYIRFLWEQIIFPFYLLKDNLRILHSLGYVGPLVCPTKHIVSILDLNYKRHGPSMPATKRLFLGSMVKLMSIFSTRIITISMFSKKEICEVLKIKKDKVIVTLLSGSSDQYSEVAYIPDLKSLYKIDSDYIIAFGSPSKHKNIIGLIKSFAALDEIHNGIKLVLVGHQHNNEELGKYIEQFGLSGRVLFTGFVPDEHVFPLLRASKTFVFPSFYEGFGIPLLDAQSIGVPVTSSNAASLPEVGNDGALYFDPYNIEQMTESIRTILENDSLSKDLIKKGLINRLKFTWKKTAIETLNCYKLVSN
jgi:glycosyltransferase involved in cell wall biosynthesis